MKPSVLITGASGFVASHLIPLLTEYTVYGLETRATDSQPDHPDYHHITGDITDPDQLKQLVTDIHPDYIIHLAAIAISWTQDFHQVININTLGTTNIYDAVLHFRQTQPDYQPKILFISSAEVYGNTPSPEHITETSPTNPTNPYAVSKLAADRASYAYALAHDLHICVIRPFNHTGPGQRPGFFVPDMVSQIVEREQDPHQDQIKVGNLQSTRDFLDVRDVVQAYKLLLTADWDRGDVFNICSGTGITMQSILDQLLTLSSKPITITPDPDRLRPSDMPIYVGDHTKLSQLTGWHPQIPLHQTLSDTLDWWRQQ